MASTLVRVSASSEPLEESNSTTWRCRVSSWSSPARIAFGDRMASTRSCSPWVVIEASSASRHAFQAAAIRSASRRQ